VIVIGIGPIIGYPIIFLLVILPLAMFPSLITRLALGWHINKKYLILSQILITPQLVLTASGLGYLFLPLQITFSVAMSLSITMSFASLYFWIRATAACGTRYYGVEGGFILLTQLGLIFLVSM